MGLLTRRKTAEPKLFDRIREDFDRALHRLWSEEAEIGDVAASGSWIPRVDVSECDNEMEVKVDLPGMDPEDIEISFTEQDITIKGERKEESEENGKHFRRVERDYGAFYRRIPLPVAADTDRIEAQSANGVITIVIPKLAEAKSKRIPVKPR